MNWLEATRRIQVCITRGAMGETDYVLGPETKEIAVVIVPSDNPYYDFPVIVNTVDGFFAITAEGMAFKQLPWELH